MAYPISNVYRRVQYTGSAGVGPYSFSFEILSNTDISVYKNQTLLTLTTDYTVTINANGTGSVTLVSAATAADDVTIYGSRAIERTSDFVTGGDLFANTLNDELDSIVIFTQQNKEEISRALIAPVTDPTTIDLTLPGKDDRAGYVLSFNDTTGDPEVTTTVGQINMAETYAANALTSQNAAASSASSASTSASNAATSASASAASAAAAAASVNGGMYSAVQDKSANYTVVAADAGDLIRVTTTSGVVTITLPVIGSAGVGDGFKVAIVKWTSDSNSVTITRSGTNTINGVTAYSIGTQYNSATLVADAETGQWFVAPSGIGTANIVLDVFSGNGSQTAFTLANDPGSKNNTFVYVGTAYQQKSSYSLSGAVLTFNSAPAAGTNNIEIAYVQTQAIGVPSDGTVTTTKIADANVTLAKLSATGTPSSTTYLRGDNTWSTIQVGFTGATAVSSATTVTLTNASTQIQLVSMTAAGQFVVLPSATTMTKGAVGFIIQNMGAYSFGVKDGAGNIIFAAVNPYQNVNLSASDNSTTGGKWTVVGAQPTNTIPLSYGATNLSGTVLSGIGVVDCCALTSTTALIVYNTGTTAASAVIATISGNTVTLGTPVSLWSATYSSVVRLVGLSATSAVVFTVSSPALVSAQAISISGSTITAGTVTSTGYSYSVDPSQVVAIADTSTTGLLVVPTSATVISAKAFSVSGTTITFGTGTTPITLTAGGSGWIGCNVARSAANTYVVAASTDAPDLRHRALTLSGTTITLGTTTTQDTALATVGNFYYGFSLYYAKAWAAGGSGWVSFPTPAGTISLQYSGTTYTAGSAYFSTVTASAARSASIGSLGNVININFGTAVNGTFTFICTPYVGGANIMTQGFPNANPISNSQLSVGVCSLSTNTVLAAYSVQSGASYYIATQVITLNY